jgi:hypothetical protein
MYVCIECMRKQKDLKNLTGIMIKCRYKFEDLDVDGRIGRTDQSMKS